MSASMSVSVSVSVSLGHVSLTVTKSGTRKTACDLFFNDCRSAEFRIDCPVAVACGARGGAFGVPFLLSVIVRASDCECVRKCVSACVSE